MVTHEADIAAYADRIVTMRDGQIVSDVRPTSRHGRAQPHYASDGRWRCLPARKPAAGSAASRHGFLGVRP